MIVATIILAYIVSIFFNRWLNNIMWNKFDYDPMPVIWFVPIVSTFIMICFLMYEFIDNRDTWFTGRDW